MSATLPQMSCLAWGEKTANPQSCRGAGGKVGCPEPLGATWGFSTRFPFIVGSSDVREIMEHIWLEN